MNMKKSAAVCGIIFGVFLLGSAVQADTVTTGMNFRSMPSASGSLIGSIPKGAEVEVLNSENGWDYVSYNGIGGWIHGGNIARTPAAQINVYGTGTVTVSTSGNASVSTPGNASASTAGNGGSSVKVLYGMNFREQPGMNGRIMGAVPAGTTVQYLGSSNGWDRIVYNGMTGWIASGRTTAASAASASSAATAAPVTTGSPAVAAGTSDQRVKLLYGMNFRATPGMNGRIMGGIPAGTTVQYLGSSNGWDKVVYNGVTGWIASGRTASIGAQALTLSSVAGTTKTVTSAMNFRATGDLSGSLIGLIPVGSKVTYVTCADGWEQVIYNGRSGWIKGGNTR